MDSKGTKGTPAYDIDEILAEALSYKAQRTGKTPPAAAARPDGSAAAPSQPVKQEAEARPAADSAVSSSARPAPEHPVAASSSTMPAPAGSAAADRRSATTVPASSPAGKPARRAPAKAEAEASAETLPRISEPSATRLSAERPAAASPSPQTAVSRPASAPSAASASGEAFGSAPSSGFTAESRPSTKPSVPLNNSVPSQPPVAARTAVSAVSNRPTPVSAPAESSAPPRRRAIHASLFPEREADLSADGEDVFSDSSAARKRAATAEKHDEPVRSRAATTPSAGQQVESMDRPTTDRIPSSSRVGAGEFTAGPAPKPAPVPPASPDRQPTPQPVPSAPPQRPRPVPVKGTGAVPLTGGGAPVRPAKAAGSAESPTRVIEVPQTPGSGQAAASAAAPAKREPRRTDKSAADEPLEGQLMLTETGSFSIDGTRLSEQAESSSAAASAAAAAPETEATASPAEESPVESPETAQNPDWEQEFRRSRQEKVAEFQKKRENHPLGFQLAGEEEEDNEPDEEPLFGEDEEELEDYSSPEEAGAVQHELTYRRRVGWIGVFLSLILELVLILLSVVVHFTGTPAIESYWYIGLHGFLLAALMLINHRQVGSGLVGLFRLRATADSPAAAAGTLALIHTVLQFFHVTGVSGGTLELLAPVAGFSLLLGACGRQARVVRISENFRFLAHPGEKFTARRIEDEGAAVEIGRPAVALGQPEVAYFRPASFLTHFLENSYAEDGSDRTMRLFTPLLLAGSLVLAVVFGFWRGDWWMALTVGCAAFCLSAPAALTAVNFPLLSAARKSLRRGGMISGWTAVEEYGETDAVVVDAADLFPSESVLLHGIKTFSGARIDQAIMDAAAVSITAGGPLAAVFRRVIEDKLDILQPVDNLVYEQDMGLSGWVGGRRVLIGNRKLLENHGVDVPSRDYELRYTKEERQLVYLSTAGELSAMFVVSYLGDEGIMACVDDLTRAKVTLLVRTCDPNITEERITSALDIDGYYVEMMGNAAGRTFGTLLDLDQESEVPAVLACNGRIEGMTTALSVCRRLKGAGWLALIAQIVCSGLAFAWSVVLALRSGMVLPPLYALIFLLGSAAISWVLPKLKGI